MPIRFQVDADFYDHPKTTGMSADAFKLWVRAGSFSAAKLTDGFITEDVLAETLRAEVSVADELVRRRLWRRVKGGYKFHDWDERNLTKQRVQNEKQADRERKAREREAARKARGQNGTGQVAPANVRPDSDRSPPGFQTESEGIPASSVSVSVSESVSGSGQGPGPPSPTCREHRDDPDPPACGRCKDARKARETWDAGRSQQLLDAPKCRTHRGQLAYNCAGCRSEKIGAY